MNRMTVKRTGQGSPGARPAGARPDGAMGAPFRGTSSHNACRDGGRTAFGQQQRTNACDSAFGWTIAIAGLGLVAWCAAAVAQVSPPAPSVSVVPVASRQVTEADDYIGRVTATDKVDIVARVPGFLEQRNFTEGQPVKTGDLLFRIEQDTYKAAVEQQRATLAKAKATEINAALQLARSKELVRNENISQATVDQRAADEASAQADILAAKAALDQAEINLRYTEIRSPIDGRIGIANFTVGNLVGPSSGSLATIVSQDPIYVIFQASERDVLDYKRRFDEPGGAKNGPITVRIKLTDGSVYPELGVPDFLDIQVDNTTDTVAVRPQAPEPAGTSGPWRLRHRERRPRRATLGAGRSPVRPSR